MNKTRLNVPKGAQFISDWEDYIFPKGHVIVDKGVTGCGYTEYCLTNKLPIVLCSPRKLLLENKSEQHQGDPNILYLKNEINGYGSILEFRNKIKSFIQYCHEDLNEPAKLLVTYDSSHYVVDALKEEGLLEEFYFVVDEFQSIFLDAYYKSDVEFDFVEGLRDCPNVLYLSATPMLDKYLNRIPEFMNLPFYEINWEGTGVVEKIIIKRKFSRSLSGDCIKIIKDFLNNKFPYTYINNNIVFSTEAVFYFNSISDIIRVINKLGLTSDQVNIICADNKENQAKLEKIGHSIGKIPLKGEPNKKFTFCTKTAYIGSDFYSTCASSYVFADPNINSLALDISLDLPQIAGRQRDKNNPFKNNITVFYKTIRKNKVIEKEEFDKTQIKRKNSTDILLKEFFNMSDEGKNEYIKKLKDGIKVSQYSDDFVSISKSTGLPVYNNFIEIANERAWDVSQKDYQDKISVTKAFEDISGEVSEYKSDLEKEIDDFLDNHFYKTGIFKEKMKMYCEFMDKHQGSQEVSDSLYFRIKDDKYRKYYNFFGTSGCRANSYEELKLYTCMMDSSKESILYNSIYTRFKSGDRYSKKDIKQLLGDLYRDLGISRTPKATDLGNYFKLVKTNVINPQTKKIENGFRLDPLF